MRPHSGGESLEQRRTRDRRRRWLTTTGVALTLVAGSAIAVRQLDDVTSPYATENATAAGHSARQPLGRPPHVPHGQGTFEFTAEQAMSDEPVAYDPCRRVPWAIHDELAPPGTDRIVERAVREVAEATGLVFVRRDVGRHSDFYSVTLNDGRSPVIIDWTTPSRVGRLRGPATGVAGSLFLPDSAGERRYVTGAAALDTPQLRRVLDRPNGAALVQTVVMHVLGHVVGLDDVDDPHELMFGGGISRLDFGPGDREGLAALGSGSCAR